MKRKEENQNNQPLKKDWKKPELKVLDKSGTRNGATPDTAESYPFNPTGSPNL